MLDQSVMIICSNKSVWFCTVRVKLKAEGRLWINLFDCFELICLIYNMEPHKRAGFPRETTSTTPYSSTQSISSHPLWAIPFDALQTHL